MSKQNHIDAHVGKKLKYRRTMVGLSQEDLGRSVGVTFQQIQKYEKGMNRIGSSRLYEISKILNVPVSYFFEDIADDAIFNVSSIEDINKEIDSGAKMNDAVIESTVSKMGIVNDKEILVLVRAYRAIKDHSVRSKIVSLMKAFAGVKEEDFEKITQKETTEV